jgi:hypothetical protein
MLTIESAAACDHGLDDRAHAEMGAGQIDVEAALPVGQRRASQRRHLDDPGVVHQRIEPPESLHRRVPLIRIRHIQMSEMR